MKTSFSISLCSILVTLAGCAADAGGELDAPAVVRAKFGADPLSGTGDAASVAPLAVPKVDVTLAAIGTDSGALSLRACPFLARNPGDFTGGRWADIVVPGCVFSADGAARLPLDAQSELVVTVYADGYPGYTAQLTTGRSALDLSRAPLPLLTQAQIDAAYVGAGVESDAERTTVIVASGVAGASYELLIDMHAQGRAPIYLDAAGRLDAGATSALENGFVLFANAPTGMHAVTFGHAKLDMERAPGMGWANSPEGGDTVVWTFPGHAHVVAGIEALGDEL